MNHNHPQNRNNRWRNLSFVLLCLLIVGGIVNPRGNRRVRRGEEKGYFELAGSTITLLFEKGRICLRPEIEAGLRRGEVQVRQGEWIATQMQ